MGIKTLYKRNEGENLTVVGHLSNKEVNALIRDGYRFPKQVKNKHGIRVER